ncbi:putative membrane protein [Solibacillus kalamii]|uniref:Acyl-CoA dehydrogenase n=1 Tax=Solibacillus kalamii TaxID=1748298 RepID=A0ABX3ZE32_9BACL|nr:acyl-CoA dehydrogenase [Solibacillus kalamii]MBM7666443.1 putative membrane protein [Solibacillus kalamii]OUZ37965.1 acyl-CoA dehydrogenase [Solibacillus kalamii]
MTFTYENFAKDGTLTLLDPLFTLLLIFSALFIIVLLGFSINPKIMLFIGALIILLSAQLQSIAGILADELNLASSSKNFYIFIAIVVIQVGLIVFAFVKDKKKK